MPQFNASQHPRGRDGKFQRTRPPAATSTAADTIQAAADEHETALPGVFFHGTRHADRIRQDGFQHRRAGVGQILGPGIYLSPDEDWSSDYGDVIEVDVTVTRVLRSEPSRWDPEFREAFDAEYGDASWTDKERGNVDLPKMGRLARDMGYDAVAGPKTVCVFDPDNVTVRD